MGNGEFLVDTPGGQINVPRQYANRTLSQAQAASIVQADAGALSNLISQIQIAQAEAAQPVATPAAMSRGGMMSMVDSGSGNLLASFPSNSLYLNMLGVSNGLAYLNICNATNMVYAIMSTTNLSPANWTVEEEVWPTNATMPFTVAQLRRTNLFLCAMDWTWATEGEYAIPSWWVWMYFGTTLSVSNLNSYQLWYDYQYGINPNPLAFTLAVTNQYMSTSQAPVSLNVSQGMACALAVLVDDTNLADATWTPYSASVTGNLVFTNGNPSRPFSSQGEFNMCHRAVENRPDERSKTGHSEVLYSYHVS